MPTENVSEDEKQNTFTIEQVYCLSDITAETRGQLILISAFNAFLAITAFFLEMLWSSLLFVRSLPFIHSLRSGGVPSVVSKERSHNVSER